MPRYPNGRIPESELMIFKRGWNSTDGDWYHGLPPATYARHLALIKRAKDRTGRTLAPGDGWTTYRPYHAQEIARRIWGNGAAVPGTSSHGGFWERRDTMAVDYSNWAWVYQYHGGQASFFADCRAVGLTPGMIMRSRGYPDEPWHVIDLDPWGGVPQFAGVFTPSKPEEDDMYSDDDRKRDVEAKKRVDATYAAVFGARNLTGDDSPLSWVNRGGGVQRANYGLLPIVIHNQTLIAQQSGRLAAIEAVVEQLAEREGVELDYTRIEAAAERGAARALGGLEVEAPEAV